MELSNFRSAVISAGCIYALYIALFSCAVLTFGGMPIHVASINTWIFDRYLLAIMFLPCCLFAFIPRWWSTLPLWISCLWVSFSPFFLSEDAANKWGHPLGFIGHNRAIEIVCIILLPLLIQLSKAPKANRSTA